MIDWIIGAIVVDGVLGSIKKRKKEQLEREELELRKELAELKLKKLREEQGQEESSY